MLTTKISKLHKQTLHINHIRRNRRNPYYQIQRSYNVWFVTGAALHAVARSAGFHALLRRAQLQPFAA